MKYLSLILILFMAMASCHHEHDHLALFAEAQWVDLTWAFDEEAVYWPTNIPFKHDTVFEGITEKGYYYASFKYSAEEHGGTHFDAPIHFAEGGKTVEQINLNKLMGEGVVIDVKAKVANNRDYLVSTQDFIDWEAQHGRIPDHAIILLNTGMAQYYPDKEMYAGTSLTGQEGVDNLHFPGLHPDAAQWLVDERNINAVGLDTPSIDYGQSKDFLSHRILFPHEVTVYENVMNLDLLPPKGSWIIALPMKIKGGSGAPLRIIAFLPPA